MRTVIAGGHGQIALLLSQLLHARGDEVVSLIRNPDQTADIERAGASAVVIDLEQATSAELAPHLAGADAVVFAAGAGPNSGAARKDTVDRAAAVLLADAAADAGVNRYLLVSAMGVDAEPGPDTDEVWAAYLRAKKSAETAIENTPLAWTILRPGGLTNDPPTDTVELAPSVGRGSIPRADVAAVLVALLDEPRTAGLILELVGGTSSIGDAITGALGS